MAKKKKAPSLVVETVDIDSLKQDPENTRLHTSRNIDALRASLKRFGQQKPIVVDKDGVVRAGNGLLQAAKEEGFKTVDIVRTPLSGKELAAYAVADNKTSDLSEFDWQALSNLFASIKDDEDLLLSTGFADYEIEPLLQMSDWEPPESSVAPLNEPEVTGDDDRLKRFILAYADEEEKQYWMDLLGIDDSKIVWTVSEVRELKNAE
jgi:hypothetical protein